MNVIAVTYSSTYQYSHRFALSCSQSSLSFGRIDDVVCTRPPYEKNRLFRVGLEEYLGVRTVSSGHQQHFDCTLSCRQIFYLSGRIDRKIRLRGGTGCEKIHTESPTCPLELTITPLHMILFLAERYLSAGDRLLADGITKNRERGIFFI